MNKREEEASVCECWSGEQDNEGVANQICAALNSVQPSQDGLPELPEPVYKRRTQICCGNYVVGGDYMGLQEMTCCGQPNEDEEPAFSEPQMLAYGAQCLAAAVPEGFVVVPLKPTEAMLVAANEARIDALEAYGLTQAGVSGDAEMYRAMLEAAPLPGENPRGGEIEPVDSALLGPEDGMA